MKARFVVLAVAVAAASFLIGRVTAQDPAKLNPKTAANLSTAMHGEAFAYAKYMLFAEHARKSGHPEIANLFEESAKVERFQHFAEEADLLGLVQGDAENLKDAIKGEDYEVTTMYLDFAKQAAAVGDKAAADRFEEVRHDEMGHRDAFKAALTKLETKAAGTK